ncbi:hypothetical protein L7F22_056465 [Adiantum nelumboides]|nr:hypothetical protein [Adiantum nelumboides]
MGVVLSDSTMVSSINVSLVEEGKLAKMLAKDLTQEEKQAYLAMLEGYPRLFIDEYNQMTGVSVLQHHINLKDGAKLVVQWLRRLGVIQQDALLSKVRKILNEGFIYLVEDSKWVSPVVVTSKKNGKWRVCADYKPLNAATKRDHFPLPFKDEILNEVAGYERLQSLGGQLNDDKCHIAESQVTLLGHVVFSRGIEADPGKVQALVSLPSPKLAKELVSFIQKIRFMSYLLPKKFAILTAEDTFPLMLQHMDVSARISKWKPKVKAQGLEPVELQAKPSGAHSLYFDGAYKKKVDKASVGISIQDENDQKVFGKGLLVENTHSNNEAKYNALALGLEWCVSMGIKRLNVFGDALLLIKQVHGTWACRNQGLVPRLRRVKELMKWFEAIQLYHVPRKENQEADTLASEQYQEVIVGAIKLRYLLFQGSACMHDIVNFLKTRECPQDVRKSQRQWLVHMATKYRLFNEHL